MGTVLRIDLGCASGKRFRLIHRGLAGALAAFVVVGCRSLAATPAPTSSATPVAIPSALPPTQAPTATSTPTSIPWPSVPPAGQEAPVWTGIRWALGPESNGLPAPVNQTDASGAWIIHTETAVFGWSKGFVVFRTISRGELSQTPTVVPYVSPDGRTWTQGRTLDVTGLHADMEILGIVEGPSALLAMAQNPSGGPCAPSPYDALWQSMDGLSWRRVENENDFTSIDGGSSGFVALASAVWVSDDGLTWRQTDLDATSNGMEMEGAVAFSKGFVVAAAVPLPTDGWCQETKAPSLWWSRDGRAWSRETLSPAPKGELVWIGRIDNDGLLAISTKYGAPPALDRAWTSTDGRTWALDPDSPGLNSVLFNGVLLTNGRYGLLVSAMDDSGHYPGGQGSLWGFQANLRLVALPQSGDVPPAELMDGHAVALGPTGLLVPNADGTRFWLGVPTAG